MIINRVSVIEVGNLAARSDTDPFGGLLRGTAVADISFQSTD
jgi:hypothetical protein